MNLMGKSGGSGDEEKEEIGQPSSLGQLLSFSSSSSYHHRYGHYQQQQQQQQQYQQPFLSPPSYNQQNTGWLQDGGESSQMVEREYMFEKVVTPSDVGKLNRLVIPKQHAERYFPLDSSTNYKGLQLNFEDRTGKVWRFQYSYWNSSQSYVMTKGWSRFVKEKKLDAGDVISFQRGVGVSAKDRLFIDWRRRVNPPNPPLQLPSSSDLSNYMLNNHNFIHPWNPVFLQSLPASRNPNFILQGPHSNPSSRISRSVSFRTPQQQFNMTQISELGLGFGLDPSPPPASIPPAHGKASGKRLRLFGVNMDCVFAEEEASSSSSSSLSTIPYLQLTPFGEENECNDQSTLDFNTIQKSTVCNMSLDLKMSQTEAEI